MVSFEIKDNILFARNSDSIFLDIATAKSVVKQRLDLQAGKTYPYVMHLNNLKVESKEVRMYMATEGTKGLSCGAFVVKNNRERILLNFFLMVDKPALPSRFFTNEADAIEWAKKYIETDTTTNATSTK